MDEIYFENGIGKILLEKFMIDKNEFHFETVFSIELLKRSNRLINFSAFIFGLFFFVLSSLFLGKTLIFFSFLLLSFSFFLSSVLLNFQIFFLKISILTGKDFVKIIKEDQQEEASLFVQKIISSKESYTKIRHIKKFS